MSHREERENRDEEGGSKESKRDKSRETNKSLERGEIFSCERREKVHETWRLWEVVVERERERERERESKRREAST